MDNLDRDIREAQRMGYGIHYGNYKADHPHTRDDPIPETKSVKKRRCRRCNKDFVFDKLNSFGYFCSAECRKAHCNEKNLEDQRRHRARLEVKKCLVCGASFAPCYKKQVFCGRSCAARSKNKLAGVVFTCAGCGNSFKPKAKTNKYCSLACFNKARGVKILCETEE